MQRRVPLRVFATRFLQGKGTCAITSHQNTTGKAISDVIACTPYFRIASLLQPAGCHTCLSLHLQTRCEGAYRACIEKHIYHTGVAVCRCHM